MIGLKEEETKIINGIQAKSAQGTKPESLAKEDSHSFKDPEKLIDLFMDKGEKKEPVKLGQTRKISQLEENNQFYYNEYARLYFANIILTKKLQSTINERNILKTKLNKLETTKRRHEEQIGFPFDISSEKKKQRHRRPAVEISRHFQCPGPNCQRSYGSEGSLNQHIKLKHPQLYKSCSKQHSENASVNNE